MNDINCSCEEENVRLHDRIENLECELTALHELPPINDCRELISNLRLRADIYEKTHDEDSLLKEAADTIEELSMKLSGDEAAIAGMKRELQRQLFISAEHNPRWISTSEYLPDCEHGAEVGNVVFRIGDYVHAGCFGLCGRQRDKYFRDWTDGTEGYDAKDVDAWFIPKGC